MTLATKQYTHGPPKVVTAKSDNKTKLQTNSKPEDNRLLVRVSPGHPVLSSSPYAIMPELNNFLNEKLVRKIQMTNIGYTICPVSAEAREKLTDRMGEIEASLTLKGSVKVENPVQQVAYRLSGVSCTYAVYNRNIVDLKEINASVVAEALTDLTNVAPLNVLESRGSEYTDFSPKRSWIFIYPKNTILSRNLPLFGVRISTKFLPQK